MRTPFYVVPLLAVMSVSAHAEVVVTEINFVGLQRLTPDSLYSVLPISVGETLDQQKLADSIKALYATDSFSDVKAYVDGGRIIFETLERPVIAEVNFTGNRLIPKEGLEQGLKNAKLAVGDVLKQSTLQAVENELKQQYILQGYYNSDIQVTQTLLEGNRVKLDVEFIEGKPAKVVDINIIGNHHFSDQDIKDVFAVKESAWFRGLSKSDRYAQEKLAASLENLTALYQNAGFIRFSVDNAVLNISDDKKSVFIELSITEGDQYKFGKVSFLGKQTYDYKTLQSLVDFHINDQYSQAKLNSTTNAIKNRYGNDGYYYANVRPVPRINDKNKVVDIEYYIDPVRPVYIRRINFKGNIKTKDEVLRRELRQLEGALAANEKIQLSRTRLMRTGFFKSVDMDVKPVANQPDQVDVDVTVQEQPSGSATIAAGYSQSGGVTFQVDLNQNNFMGTGNRVRAALSRSETRDYYSLGYTNPYFTENGVSQGVSAYYRKTKYDDKNISNYVTDSLGGTLNYSYPVDETKRVSAGINLDKTKVRAGRWLGISNVKELEEDGATVEDANDYTQTSFKNDYKTYSLMLGWDYNTLDRPIFPTKGISHDVNATLAFGDKKYQKIVYQGNAYFPLDKDKKWIVRGYTKLGFGHNLPFYENFYAGGYGSVRGYEPSSLGPRSPSYYEVKRNNDTSKTGTVTYKHEEVGGNALATFGTELILPIPFKGDWTDQVRPVLFAEGGQVFDTTGKEDETYDGVSLLSNNNKAFRYSAGAAITWYTPIGPLSLSYAIPIGDKEGDETDKVQFQIGNVF